MQFTILHVLLHVTTYADHIFNLVIQDFKNVSTLQIVSLFFNLYMKQQPKIRKESRSYPFYTKRILLARDPKDKSVKGKKSWLQ